ncbi:MAG TPA: hypothetical protein VHY75_01035, partial [Steroidobacteraceae bacterium]|nr:hypothetical protein [Steroidobacteraceae bacterium]
MNKAAARQEPDVRTAEVPAPGVPPKRQKLAAFLVTDDIELWPQIGAQLPGRLNFRQIDSLGDLIRANPGDLPAVVVWDARSSADKTQDLSKLQGHSARFAVIVLDERESEWTS